MSDRPEEITAEAKRVMQRLGIGEDVQRRRMPFALAWQLWAPVLHKLIDRIEALEASAKVRQDPPA